MPRRLGLSDAVEHRIRTYQLETKKGNKISDEEFAELVRLVVKRPDARAIFLECGLLLMAGTIAKSTGHSPSCAMPAVTMQRGLGGHRPAFNGSIWSGMAKNFGAKIEPRMAY